MSPIKIEKRPFVTVTGMAVGVTRVPELVYTRVPPVGASYREKMMEYVPSGTEEPEDVNKRAW